MRTADFSYRGSHVCAGLILHPGLTGQDQARGRVLKLWSVGAQLRQLPDGLWFLEFAMPIEMHSANAGGSLVVKSGSGLSAAGGSAAYDRPADKGMLVYWLHGDVQNRQIALCPLLDPSLWLSLDMPVQTLEPLNAPPAQSVAELMPPPPTPDMRKAAGVSGQSSKADKFASDLRVAEAQIHQSRSGIASRGNSGSGRRAQRHGQSSGRRPKPSKSREMFTRLAMRSFVGNEIQRRHARYLQDLQDKFLKGDLAEALRHAIPLGGLGSAGTTMRMPGRRESLQLTAGSTAGRSLPLGATVHSHLTELYRQAAKDLEAAGQIDEAAFVLAELLNDVLGCALMLERHRRYATAAALVENRSVAPDLAVRLWWLAGDRERAMSLARKCHCYELVLSKLGDSDPEAAHEFRLLWVDELERSGNTHGAIAAGWADEQIRPLLRNLIRAGVEADDEWSLGISVYGLAIEPSEENRSAFIERLRDSKTTESALRFMAGTLAGVVMADPVADREACSEVLRVLIGLPQTKLDKSLSASFAAIRERGDPVLAVDLPPIGSRRPELAEVKLGLMPPGHLTPLDVVPLSSGRLLVALGEIGVRLLTSDGRTAAEWSVPCHQFVPADHEKSVLLLTLRGLEVEVTCLNLVTYQTQHYGSVQSSLWAKSFDGASWAATDDRGIAFYDILAKTPTVNWRMLEPSWSCHALERSPEYLTTIITVNTEPLNWSAPHESSLQVWRWTLPNMRLDTRQVVKPAEHSLGLNLLTDNTSIWTRVDEASVSALVVPPKGQPFETVLEDALSVRTSGDYLGVINAARTLTVSQSVGGGPVVSWENVQGEWNMRVQGRRLAIWTSTGNAVVIDLDSRIVLVRL